MVQWGSVRDIPYHPQYTGLSLGPSPKGGQLGISSTTKGTLSIPQPSWEHPIVLNRIEIPVMLINSNSMHYFVDRNVFCHLKLFLFPILNLHMIIDDEINIDYIWCVPKVLVTPYPMLLKM